MKRTFKTDVAGVIHNHCSDYSPDANESFDSMVVSARKAKLDFIVFTDHNSIGVKENARDRNYSGVQVIAGTEITPHCEFSRFEDHEIEEDASNGHLLIFNLAELPDSQFIDAGIRQELVDFANERGLMSFIAHPDHKGTKYFGVPAYNCTNFNIKGYTGFALWDLQSDWQNSATGILTALKSYLFPAYVLEGPEPETLARWDDLTKSASFTIVGEIDQHSYEYKLKGIKFTIFKSSFAFRTIRTHAILSAAVDTNKDFGAELLVAMRRGHTYASLDYYKDATGFRFDAEHGSARYIMGDTFSKRDGGVWFHVELPHKGVIRVIRDGKVFMNHTGKSLKFTTTEKGVYRVEVSLKRLIKLHPWIYSNTIRVI